MDSNYNYMKSETNWRPFETIDERLKHLFSNHLMTDIVFKLKSNARLPAHKLILSSGSQVFHQLFNESINENNWKLSFEDKKECIELNDCELKHFRPLIEFLYTDQLDINEENAKHVMYWSKILRVNGVTHKCRQFIESKLNDQNCLKWWQTLTDNKQTLTETKLIDKCLQTISSNASNVFKGHDFINLSIDELITLFARNDLKITEFDLFNASIRWTKQMCFRNGLECNEHNLRQALGLAFELIRFPLMTCHEFGQIVSAFPQLFSRDELSALISYVNCGQLISHSLRFSSRPRIPICGDIQHTNPCLRTPPPQSGYFVNQIPCSCQTYPMGYPRIVPHIQTYTLLSPYRASGPISPPHSVLPVMPTPSHEVWIENRNRNRSETKLNLRFRRTQPFIGTVKPKPRPKLKIVDPKTGQIVNLEELAKSEGEDKHCSDSVNKCLTSNNDSNPSKSLNEIPNEVVANTEDSDNDIWEELTPELSNNENILKTDSSESLTKLVSESYFSEDNSTSDDWV